MIALNTGFKCGLFACTALTAMLAGCQSSALLHHPRSSANQGDDRQPKINTRQTADVQYALGRSLEKRGEYVPAAAAYREAVKHDPRRGDAYLRLAILHDQQGKHEEAAEFYRKALEARPGDPDIYCDRGYSFYLQRRWAEAELNLRQAIALKPDLPRAHNNLGLVLSHMDRPEEALAEYRKAGCNSAEAYTNLAFCQTLENRLDDAGKSYELASTSNPSSDALKKMVREFDSVRAKVASPVASMKAKSSEIISIEETIVDRASTAPVADNQVQPAEAIKTDDADDKVEFILTEEEGVESSPMPSAKPLIKADLQSTRDGELESAWRTVQP